MLRNLRPILLTVALATCGASGTRAAEPAPEAVEFFEREIRPLLIARYYVLTTASLAAATLSSN